MTVNMFSQSTNSPLRLPVSSAGLLTGMAEQLAEQLAGNAVPPDFRRMPFSDGDVCRRKKILIIDDELINARIIQNCLQFAGYRTVEIHTEPETALDRIRTMLPDLVICDVIMSVSGLDILEQVTSSHELHSIPMIMISASDDERVRTLALELGATELLTKPLRDTSLLPRVRNSLLLKSHVDQLKHHSRELESQVQNRTTELMLSRLELIHCLAKLAEFRDSETGRHVVRVGLYSGILARTLGLPPSTCELIEHAAPLHDIGKIGVPDDILRKPGRLTCEEFELMQKHVGLGESVFQPQSLQEAGQLRSHTILGEMMICVGSSPLLRMASEIALTHHERWDGAGYPNGLACSDIPISGRIVAVADVFDALSSKRVYKPAFPIDKCVAILQEGSGTQFDPDVIAAFLKAQSEIVAVRIELADVD